MTKTNKTTRFTVLDASDRFVGVWYAATEVDAIRAATACGYDAWSAGNGAHRRV